MKILRHLPVGARVLDFGSRGGSFDASTYPVRVVRVDLEIPSGPQAAFVQADASSLPFPNTSFDAVIANHSLEHFERLEPALRELGRVVRPSFYLHRGAGCQHFLRQTIPCGARWWPRERVPVTG